MLKPRDYDQTAAYGEYKPLELGGHICKIMAVEETKSRNGADMLIISLDTAPQDKQPGYYTEQYRADDRPDKKWGCRVFQLVYDNDEHTNRGFKTFITAVEKSNPGFQVQWGDGFASCFKGRLIGGVFGREQYLNANNEAKWSTKCMFFRSVEAIQEGVEVPKDKYLKGYEQPQAYGGASNDEFKTIDDSEDLPF